MENWQWVIDIFTFIGMIVCILIALIAIVWLTCFAVKLLIKTFSVRVGKSLDLAVEDINKKAEAKKERNDLKRKAAAEKKLEILNMKLESKQRVHEIKKAKLAEKLENQENIAKTKLFGEIERVEEQKIDKSTTENIVKNQADVNENDEKSAQKKPRKKNNKEKTNEE